MSPNVTDATPRHDAAALDWTVVVAWLAAGILLGLGGWALLAPRSFFEVVAAFEPYNVHLLHDLGAFQLGLGAVLVIAIRSRDALAAALLGVGLGMVVHTVAHVLDRDLGGNPALDIPSLGLLAIVLLAAGVARLRRR